MNSGHGIIVSMLMAIVLTTACSPATETRIFSSARDRTGQLEARVQMTDAGAATGFSRVVMVHPVSATTEPCRALALDGEPDVVVRWGSGGDLIITHGAPRADVIFSQSNCLGRRIQIVQESR